MSAKKLYCEICSKKFPIDISVTELVNHLSSHRKDTLERFILAQCWSEIFKTGVQTNHTHSTEAKSNV